MVAEMWRYSIPVDADQIISTGCFTSLPVRIHKCNDLADESTRQSLEDWGVSVGDGWERKSGSCWSPVGNWASFIFPESFPERLPIVTYLANIGNIHDDLCEDLDYDEALAEHASLSKAMDLSAGVDDAMRCITDGRITKLKQCIGKALIQAIEIDRPRGMRMIDSYRKKWLDVMESGNPKFINNMDDYLAFRNLNGGMEPYWLLVQYSMAIDISKEEENRIKHIFQAAESALVLTNDYWSWDREWRAAMNSQTPRIVNAIELLMRTADMTMDEARSRVYDLILDYEAVYTARKESFYRENPEIPPHLQHYIEVCGSVIAGNHFWCANCPRHNKWRNDEHALPESSFALIPDDVTTSASSVRDQESASIGDSTNLWTGPTTASIESTDLLDHTALEAPSNYVSSMPSKSVRTMMIHSLDTWLNVKAASLGHITDIVNAIHQASLIMDDIEDGSQLRRGMPAVHTIFGVSQSVNTSNFMWVQAVRLATKLQNPSSLQALLDGLDGMLLGQSWDLKWKHDLHIPSEQEYLEMVGLKTGGLFKMIIRLMSLESRVPEISTGHSTHLDKLARVFGHYFQIRDDYMNLCSAEQSEQKGFCEDLDEGKLSYPLLQLLLKSPLQRDQIVGVLRHHLLRRQSTADSKMPTELKHYMLKLMKTSCALQSTLMRLKDLEREIYEIFGVLEQQFECENTMLRLLLKTLSVDGMKESLSDGKFL